MLGAPQFEKVHVLVSGRVQGVGFRYATQRAAEELGLSGWVRNLPDGRVEASAEGDAEKIAAFLEWCKVGPRSAHVEHLDVKERSPLTTAPNNGFHIRHDET